MKKIIFLSIILISSFVFSACTEETNTIGTFEISPVPTISSMPAPTSEPMKDSISKPTTVINAEKQYSAIIKTTQGDITVKLFADKSPLTVNNFVYLAQQKFYEGTIFHRIIKDFMIQGGDPLGTGTGGPGYSFKDEFNDEKLVKGSLAMANSGPDTNGSQFFIVTAESTPWLDGKHTNFGMVTDGLDVVELIGTTQTGIGDKPINEIKIESIEIIEE